MFGGAIITHNMDARFAFGRVNYVRRQQDKTLEKLSSGYRINRSADDAAGLAISEQMRRQIRGLDQGTSNVKEGIGFIHVGDGALNEVHSMLQRMNRLSIQAVNGTYDKQARDDIQLEVDELKAELSRIFDTTNYNGIPLFKGDNDITVEKTVTNAPYTIRRKAPGWMAEGMSNELSKSNSAGLQGKLTGTDGRVYSNSNEILVRQAGQAADGSPIYDVYAPVTKNDKNEITGISGSAALMYPGLADNLIHHPDQYRYQGTLSGNLDNVASASIDFSHLSEHSRSACELYNNLSDLLGTSIGVPCGTCSDRYGITFTGVMGTLSVDKKPQVAFAHDDKDYTDKVDLTSIQVDGKNLIDVLDEEMKKQKSDENLTDAERLSRTQELAAKIEDALYEKCKAVLKASPNWKHHFDRAGFLEDKDTGSKKIVIFDYRDTDKLQNEDASSAGVSTDTKIDVKMTGTINFPAKEPLWIQASASREDRIGIRRPSLSLYNLGLNDYRVNRYGDKTVTHYSDAYLKKLEQWKKDNPAKVIHHPEVPSHVVTEQYKEITGYVYDENGEAKPTIQIKERSRLIPAQPAWDEIKAEDKPQPGAGDVYTTQEYGYIPDDFTLVQNAINKISMARAQFGAEENRLEHTLNNDRTMDENITSSESRIRDTDMAKEIARFTKNNVLLQAGNSLLAQANQRPNQILQLMQA